MNSARAQATKTKEICNLSKSHKRAGRLISVPFDILCTFCYFKTKNKVL